MTVKRLEERWTPTTIHATFVFHPPSRNPKSGGISIDLPLLNLGWTFALSLKQRAAPKNPRRHLPSKPSTSTRCQWVPAAFSFRRNDSTIPWGNTSMNAQLSLAMEQNDRGSTSSIFGQGCTPHNDMGSDSTPLGTVEAVLAHTPSLELQLITSCTLSLLRPTKVWLTVTISECPFANGLFQAVASHVNEGEAKAQLIRQSGDRVLSRSLATGKLFDVKFLTFSTRSTSGNTAKQDPTYASLSVLEKHVNLPSAKLGEGWTSALAALNCRDNADAKYVGEILCPKDYEYEPDSDFEDEDEASSPVEPCASSPPCERNMATVEGQQSESSTERSGGSFSSFELEGVSNQGPVDCHLEEVIKGPGEPPHLFSLAAANHEPTILVRFAAHRTWHAFLWYCYTGHLEFSKLKSQAEPGTRHLRVTRLEGGPLSCSPKSMYRLADLVGDNVLKAKALEAIKERMTEASILDETFSVFTSKYPDVREVQLGVLMEHCGSPEVKKAFLRTMTQFGNMPHAEPVLSAFYDRLAA